MAKGNKESIHTTIDKRTERQIQDLLDAGNYPSKSSLIVDAIDKVHREKTNRIKLHPKAAQVVQKLKRQQETDYSFEQIANQIIINYANQQNSNDQND